MTSLEIADLHILRAVEGWIELGNYAEAHRELDALTTEKQEHPDAVEFRFQVYASEKKWDPAQVIARKLTEIDPGRVAGWLHLAYATRRASGGSLQAAWDILLPVAERFRENATINYNLACYACQLGDHAAARQWLKKSLKAGNAEEIKRMALSDSDLAPLKNEISTM